MKSLCLIVACLLLVTSCAKNDRGLEFRDSAGNVVATGDLQLPDEWPSTGQSFEGRWQLTSSTGSFPATSVKSGKYSAKVHGQSVVIDLNPDMFDSNVVLSGTITNGSLSGKWYHATIAGGEEMGSFSVTGPTGRAR